MSSLEIPAPSIWRVMVTSVLGLACLAMTFFSTYVLVLQLTSIVSPVGNIVAVAIPAVATYFALKIIRKDASTVYGMYVFCGAIAAGVTAGVYVGLRVSFNVSGIGDF
jgi:hypothetical protein